MNKRCPHCTAIGQMTIENEGMYHYLICMPCGFQYPLDGIGHVAYKEKVSLLRIDATSQYHIEEKELELV